MSILVIVFVMIHTLSCIWILIGESYDNTWIKNPNGGLNAIYGDK